MDNIKSTDTAFLKGNGFIHLKKQKKNKYKRMQTHIIDS